MPHQNPNEPITKSDLRDRLSRGLAALDIGASTEQRDRLLAFLALLQHWNRAYNLTSVRDPLDMVPRHLLDSLSVSPYLFSDPILDAGTGAGLPGIPLAIVHPARRFILLDSNGKKVRFVRQAALELGLVNVTAVQARLESYRPGGKFATIVSRAVASIPALAAAAGHILARPARLLVMKGRYPANELDATPLDSRCVHRIRVPDLEGERHLIEIRYD